MLIFNKLKKSLGVRTIELLICTISFLAVFCSALIISLSGSATSYEISIYNVFTPFLWVLIIIPFTLPFVLFFNSKGNFSNFYLTLSIIGAVLAAMILYLLPYFRGYELYGAGDLFNHLYDINKIIILGHIDNVYPFIHILISELSLIGSPMPVTISFFINPMFLLIFFVGVYLLSFEFNKNVRTSLFITAISIIPILGSEITRESIMPSLGLFLFLPLVLFVFFKSYNYQKINYTSILIILIFIFPFFHPETTLFLAIILLTLYILHKIFSLDNINFKTCNNILPRSNTNVILFLAVSFIFWFTGAQIFGGVVDQIASSLFSNTFEGPIASKTDAYSFKSFYDNVKFFIIVYGPSFIYLTFAGIFSLIVYSKILLKKMQDNFNIIFSSIFLVLCLMTLIFLLKGFIISFSAFRILKYPLLVSFIILGSYLIFRMNKVPKKQILVPIFLIIIVLPTILSVFSAYNSPLIFGHNYQITKQDFSGMNFLFDYRNENNQIIETITKSYQTRFGKYLLGDRSYKNIRSGYNENILPPFHFGYTTNSMLGQSYEKDNYVILIKLSEIFYQNVYPKYEKYWRFNNSDFSKLMNYDQSVNVVYNNGDFRILFLKGLGKST